MTVKALVKLLTVSVVLSAVDFISLTGKAQIPTPTANWVNIKDPKFGAMGNGNHDDTAAIQAAIDYAFAHNLMAVYCPAGNYKTSSTLYLDPPGNMRTSGRLSPTIFNFSMSFFGDSAASGNYQGCRISPTFNNDVAFLVGTGQGMRVSDIAVIGPSGNYRGQQNSSGVGIGLSGGNGGSSINIVENTYVANFYTLYATGANGAGNLNDSNTWRKVAGDNGYYGISINATQNYIDDVIEPRLSATVDIYSPVAKAVNVYGGNLSAGSGQNASFGISSISSFSKTGDGNGYDYTFTATIVSPDQYVGTVYNSYSVVTAHFGVIPLTMTNWNAGTNVGTFQIWTPWVFANYGAGDLTTYTDIQAEVAAVTTLYAAERVTVAWGMGIVLDGVHIENPSACQTLFDATAGFGGATSNEVKNPFFNSDPSDPSGTANLHCQESFPFIYQQTAANNSTLVLDGGSYGNAGLPLIIDTVPYPGLSGSSLTKLGPGFNMRVVDNGGYAYGQTGGYGQFAAEGRGAGVWDDDYTLSANFAGGAGYSGKTIFRYGEISSPFCGYEPCPWVTPQLSPANYALVSGTLGALGSYPPIACRTVFKSVDWNTGAITPPSTVGGGIFKRSASCPGFSYGQNLTDALVGETLTWSYKGQSNVLYLDYNTLNWMFPGLGISINNGSGAVPYVVTGVYPLGAYLGGLGYVTVIGATGGNGGGGLAGTKTTVYSCSSGCTILQAPFAWTAY